MAALVTNTRSPEPPNSALLNFMKGLAVQFMSLTAEERAATRRNGGAAPDEIKQDQQKFYPWQHSFYFLSLHAEKANARRDVGWKH